MIGFVLFFAWLGFGGDFIYYLATSDAGPQAYHHTFPWFGLLMTAIGAGIARYGFATGPNKVLWSTGAREVVDPATDQERQLVNVVEEMAIAAGIPRPRIWIVPDADPNAFATGLDQGHAHIAVTQGLLDLCSRDELQAVIAHELGHVKNLDVRLMTTLAALVGAVALMHDGMGRLMQGVRWSAGGGGGGGGARRKEGRPRPAGHHPARALGHHLDPGPDHLAVPRDGREPQAGVSRRRHGRAVHPQPHGARHGARRRSRARTPRRARSSAGRRTCASRIPWAVA